LRLHDKSSQLRIGFIAGTLGHGGAERQLIFMLRALRNEGINTRVLCLTKGEAFEKDIMNLGFKIDWVGKSQNNFVRLGRIIANFREQPVDIIQSVHFYTNIYAALSGHFLGVGSIGAIRSNLNHEFSANGVFGKWQLKLPGKLIANSQLAVNNAIARGIDSNDVNLVKNAVEDVEQMVPPNRNKGLTVLFAGRLVPIKRPELFLDLAMRLTERLPGEKLNFIIAGDGPLRKSLEKKSLENRSGKAEISFLGEQKEMSEIYRRSDLLVLTSEFEGTPNVILEAMAHGLPVVAANVGGVPEIVPENCGILVNLSQSDGLLEAAVSLIRDSAMRCRMGQNARAFVRKNHSISNLQGQLTGIYLKMLGQSG